MIIGITGRAQSGKSTIAEYLMKMYMFESLAFADEIKRLAAGVFGWDGEKDEAGRRLLQELGVCARNYDPFFWIKLLNRKVDMHKKSNRNMVISDLRFLNEAHYIRGMGGVIWRVQGRGGLSGEAANHSSETEQNGIVPDVVFDNAGSLENLYSLVSMEVHRVLV